MYSYYDHKSYADQHYEERLGEARGRHLAEQARTNREPQDGSRHLRVAWSNALATLLRGASRTAQAMASAMKGTA
jgi:hypothetical protein